MVGIRTAAAFAACLSLTLAEGARSADAAGDFAIKGAGATTCGRFLEDWDAGGRNMALYAGWIDGYVTAMNQIADATFDLTPWQSAETLLGLMRRSCETAPPEARFMDRVVALLQDLAPIRLREKSTASGLQRGDRGVVVYDAVLAAALRRLAAEGFWNGPEDAPFSELVAEALERFQHDRDLPVTGLPDQRTLAALFFEARTAP